MFFFFLREKKIPFREKTEKSAREKQATPVKKTQKVPVKNKSYPWKIPEKQNFELQMATSWIKSIFRRWNRNFTPRENFHEGTREKKYCTREKCEKSVRESDFLSVKKFQKRQKKRFTHTFDFHAGKKNTAGYRSVDSS